MNLIKDFKNDLLKRRELKLVFEAGKNPGFAEALKIISDKFKVKEDAVVVREVKSKFGRGTFLIDAFIYNSAEDKARIEPKKRKKKTGEGATTPQEAGGKK